MLCPAARAEALDAVSAGLGFDAAGFVRRLIAGEALTSLLPVDAVPGMIREGVLRGLDGLTMNLALPVLAAVVLSMMTGRQAGFMMNLLCALCCGKALAQTWFDAQAGVRALVGGVLNATERMTPVLASAAALTGGSFWASALGPATTLCASLVQRFVMDWGFKLCAGAAAAALAGAVSGGYALERLFALIKGAVHWMLGVAIFLFGAMISVQGMLSAAKDGAAARTAKVALESLIPIIGGGVSDAAGALTVSASLAKSAVGITGVALIAKLCMKPLITLGGRMVALKLLSAVMEPLSAGSAAVLIGHFGDILEMLLAIAVCCCVLAAMIPGACAALGGHFLG